MQYQLESHTTQVHCEALVAALVCALISVIDHGLLIRSRHVLEDRKRNSGAASGNRVTHHYVGLFAEVGGALQERAAELGGHHLCVA